MRDMASLDVRFAVNELRNLAGGQIQKVYQSGKAVWFEIYVPAKGSFTLRFEPGKLFITEYRRVAPETPEFFAMFARKHVQGQRIIDVRQHGFDRIVEVETEKSLVIFELFSKGNVIICGKDRTILMPLDIQIWKDRRIVPRSPYKYPPEVVNPLKITQTGLRELLDRSDRDVVRFLAVDLSLSGLYAEEVVGRSQVDKNRPCRQVSDSELIAIYEALHSLVKTFGPRLVFDNSNIIDAVPFELLVYKSKRSQPVQTFMHALDEAYTEKATIDTETKLIETAGEHVAKFERIAAEQRAAIEKLAKLEIASRTKAQALSRNADLVDSIMAAITSARDAGRSWAQIKEQFKAERTAAAQAVREIQERKGKIVVELL